MKNKTIIHPLWRLLKYARGYRTRLVLATLFSILNKLADLAPPALIGTAVDVVVQQEESILAQLGFPDPVTQLWILAGLTAVIWFLESAFEYIFSVLWRNLAQSLQHDLRIDTYSHVQDLELAYFEDNSTGNLMSVLNDDINQLERFLDRGANDIIQIVTTVFVVGGMFVVIVPSVSWMAIVPMPFVFWGSMYFQRLLAPLYLDVREKVGVLNGQLSNNLSGIATIKSFTAETHEVQRIKRESDAYRESNREAISLSSAFVPVIRMVIVTGFIAILVFGGNLALSGELNIGTYSVLVFMTQRLLWPLTQLGATLDLYQRAMASTARVLDLLDTAPQIVDGPKQLPLPSIRGQVFFDNVSFQYDYVVGDDEQDRRHIVVEDVTLRIPAGHTVALVGPTGSGKSTLIKLLLRFYDVQHGRVMLESQDIRELKMADLRRAIGLVSQDVFLFHGTVRENIAYGSFGATLDEIVEAAKIAEAHEFIISLPDGYDTIVGERGQKLSGGQRQRLSIARAVLKDPPVLILDEATSAVDNETEAAIQRSMERITVGRTTIVIAHRLSTVRNAEQIYVLENGRIKENGRHDELVEKNGLYASLWRVQTGVR